MITLVCKNCIAFFPYYVRSETNCIILPGFSFWCTALLSVTAAFVGFDLNCPFIKPDDIFNPILTFIKYYSAQVLLVDISDQLTICAACDE